MTACLFMYFLLCLSFLIFLPSIAAFYFHKTKKSMMLSRYMYALLVVPKYDKRERKNCELEAMTTWSWSLNKNIWDSFIDPAVCNRALQSKRFAVNDIASIPVALRVEWWKTTNRQKESKKTAKRMGSSVNTKSRYDIHVHSFSKIVQCA